MIWKYEDGIFNLSVFQRYFSFIVTGQQKHIKNVISFVIMVWAYL